MAQINIEALRLPDGVDDPHHAGDERNRRRSTLRFKKKTYHDYKYNPLPGQLSHIVRPVEAGRNSNLSKRIYSVAMHAKDDQIGSLVAPNTLGVPCVPLGLLRVMFDDNRTTSATNSHAELAEFNSKARQHVVNNQASSCFKVDLDTPVVIPSVCGTNGLYDVVIPLSGKAVDDLSAETQKYVKSVTDLPSKEVITQKPFVFVGLSTSKELAHYIKDELLTKNLGSFTTRLLNPQILPVPLEFNGQAY